MWATTTTNVCRVHARHPHLADRRNKVHRAPDEGPGSTSASRWHRCLHGAPQSSSGSRGHRSQDPRARRDRSRILHSVAPLLRTRRRRHRSGTGRSSGRSSNRRRSSGSRTIAAPRSGCKPSDCSSSQAGSRSRWRIDRRRSRPDTRCRFPWHCRRRRRTPPGNRRSRATR